MIIVWNSGQDAQLHAWWNVLNYSIKEQVSVLGPIHWVAGQVYVGGFQQGEVFVGGMQAGQVYLGGFQRGEVI